MSPYTIEQSNADASAYYSAIAEKHGHPRPDATPSWWDVDAEEQEAHRADCLDGCGFCEVGRTFGICTQCGAPTDGNLEWDGGCCGTLAPFHAAIDTLAELRA
ncbi:hypothetical protein BKA24_001776 [Microbacterium marinum]|uniref:Uncharacterized protein n=1 Tax=Microbacterium marinum TaxID=421115 RepID=A0A7W7BQP8_9MICO|nr:hypothetical protein [Microbacterium marinum]MBB4667067.1 hypothetical protein [Microbacterium marinum]